MTTETYESPDRETIKEVFNTALADNDTIKFMARIEAEYTGKDAGGYLSRGDCYITVKPDGTVLVHSDEKHRPRNWLTSGSTVFLDTTDANELTLNGRQNSPPENLMIVLLDVARLTTYDMQMRPTLELEGTEYDMHEHLLENPDDIEEGFRPSEHEQAEISGRIDIFGHDSNGTPVLIEVKRRQGSHKHVDQLRRYIERYRTQTNGDNDVRGILVAPSASNNVKQMLAEHNLEFVALNPFETPTSHPQNSDLTDF